MRQINPSYIQEALESIEKSENAPWLKYGMLLVEVLNDKQVGNLLEVQLLKSSLVHLFPSLMQHKLLF
jgi:hypothetical protein